jgi:hypothetical protein
VAGAADRDPWQSLLLERLVPASALHGVGERVASADEQ